MSFFIYIKKTLSLTKILVLFFCLSLTFSPLFSNLNSTLSVPVAHAAINKQINYQGKLTNASNVAVADGTYTMVFKLYTALTGGSAIWTETDNGSNKVQVTNGLFSVMLGSTTPFTGVDFNQTLYLGVTIEADSEMSPRKVLGAVPAAIEAGNSQTVGGLNNSEFIRSDAVNATSTASTYFTITQNGAGKIAEFFGPSAASALSILSNGNIGIGTTSPYAKLSVAGTVVARNFVGTSTATSTLGGGLDIATGCFAIGGVCLSSTASGIVGTGTTGQFPYYAANGSTLTATSSIFISSNGKVGIGTTSPFAVFSVQGKNNSSGSADMGFAVYTGNALGGGVGGGINLVTGGGEDGGGAINIISGSGQVSGSSGGTINITAGGASGTFSTEGGDIVLTSGNAISTSGIAGDITLNPGFASSGTYGQVLLGTGGGNVGIGTSSPYAKLSVAGEVVSRNFTATSTTATSTFAGGFIAAGTNGLNVLQNGNVGIGIASPDFKLDVRGNLKAGSSNTGSGNTVFPFYISDSSNLGWKVADSSGTSKFELYVGFGGINQMRLLGGVSLIGYSQDLTLGTDLNTSAVTIKNSAAGNVGIGTTSPYAKLSVAGTIVGANFVGTTTATSTLGGGLDIATGCFAIGGVCLSSTASGIVGAGTTGQFPFYAANGTTLTATSSLFVATNGNIGVGTTSPFAPFSVSGGLGQTNLTTTILGVYGKAGPSGAPGQHIILSAGNANSNFGSDGGSITLTAGNGSGPNDGIGGSITINPGTGPTTNGNLLLTTLTGNVGIGTTSPYAKLSVVGQVVARNFTATSTTATSTFQGTILAASGGNVGIGTTSPYVKLSVTGDVLVSGLIKGGTSAALNLNGYNNNGADLTYGNGGLFRMTESSVIGTNDVFFQGIPATTAGYTFLEGFNSAGLIIGTGGNDNPILFNTNRTERARLTSTGLSINTSNQQGALQLFSADNSGYKTYTASASNEGTVIDYYENTSSETGNASVRTTDIVSLGNQAGVAGGGQIRFLSNPTGTFTASEWMRIARNGNVGIGTTSPYAKLSVAGQIVGASFVGTTTATSTFGGGIDIATGCYAVGGVCLSSTASGIVGAGTTGQFPYYAANGTTLTATSSLTISTNGNVGIKIAGGTSLGALTLGNGDNSVGGFNTAQLALGYNGTNQYASYITSKHGVTAASNSINFYTSDGTQNGTYPTNAILGMTISGGNVGIGSTSPYAKLSVAGTVVADSLYATSTTVSSYIAGKLGIGTTTPQNPFVVSTGASTYIQIAGSGGGSAPIGIRFTATAGGTESIIAYDPFGNSFGSPPNGHGLVYKSGRPGFANHVFMEDDNTVQMIIRDGGNVGIGTTSPYAKLSVAGTIVGANFVGTTTATSTFGGGIDIATGCYAVAGTCIGSGGASQWTTSGSNIYYNTGNVGIGSTSPSFALSVNPSGGTAQRTALFQDTTAATGKTSVVVRAGAGDGSGDRQFSVLSNTGTAIFQVNVADNGGRIETNTITAITNGITIGGNRSSNGSGASVTLNDQSARFINSGSNQYLLVNGNYTPNTSGTGAMNNIESALTVNQTGGATGITRGLYVNPTLTAAADFRGIETSNNTGFALYTAGTANSYFGGNVGIGTTSPYAKLSVAGQVVADYFAATSTTATSTFKGNIVIGNISNGFANNGSLVIAGNSGIGGASTTATGNGSFALGNTFTLGSGDNAAIRASGNGSFAMGSAVAVSNTRTILSSGAGSFAGGQASNGNIISSSIASFAWGDNISSTNSLSISFGSGFTNSTTNTFQVGFSSVPALTVNATNVGIGTTSPYAKLSVAGDIVGARFVGTTTATSTLGGGLDIATGCYAIAGVCTGSGTVGAGTTGQFPYYAANGSTLTATSSLFLASNGNVGIGSTSPSSKLAVTGSGTGTGRAFIVSDSANIERFAILDNGNVGIGVVTPPTEKLSVLGNIYVFNSNSGVNVGSANNASGINSSSIGQGNTATAAYSNSIGYGNLTNQNFSSALGYGNTATGIRSSAVGNLNLAYDDTSSAFGNSNTASYALASAFGNGNTASASNASAFGNSNTASASGASAFGSNVTNNTASSVMIGPSDTAKITILSTAHVGIGTITPTFRLNVVDTSTNNVAQFVGSGAAQCTVVAGTGFSCTSDERMKQNITPLGGSLDKVLALQGVTYNWKSGDINTTQIGFIAQDVEKIIPELVRTDEQGNKSLLYAQVTPYLVEAIKELASTTLSVNLRLALLEGTTDTPAHQSFLESITASLYTGLSSLKKLVVETFTVGSKEKPSGITLFDEVTGNPYCLKVSNGVMINTSGECNAVTPSPSPQAEIIPPPSTDLSTTTPPIVESATSTPEVIPEPSPEPIATSTPPLPTPEASAGEATTTPEV